MTADLLEMLDWLESEDCTHVAIESTGVYWRPVFNLLEGHLEVILVNARHVKAVPGRKTDVKDCEWLAELLCHGLLKASFIPPVEIRELRELTRYRQTLVKTRGTIANRIQRLIEGANIKLSQVASDALGVSGRLMLRALCEGETDAEKLSTLARGSLKRKQDQLQRALTGRLSSAQRFVLTELMNCYEENDLAILRINQEIERETANCPDPFVPDAVTLLQTIPGVGQKIAEVIVSEIGVDMNRFPADRHLASWAGMCPGNNESAGKRKSGKTTKGSVYLRTALVQAAWSATHMKTTYLASQYKRLVKRRGRTRALVAVGHSIIVMAYHILQKRQSYQELGVNYFDKQNTERQQARLVRQLESLGLQVSIQSMPAAA